jgi:CBS domain-containing protein
VPVVDVGQTLLGIVTDRDICIATATRSLPPANLVVRDVMSTAEVHFCRPEDDVRTVLATMGRHRVRRLPVLARESKLVGNISLADLARRADYRSGAEVPAAELLDALRSISTPSAVPAHA